MKSVSAFDGYCDSASMGSIMGQDVAVVRSGIGPVAAASCIQSVSFGRGTGEGWR